MIKLGKRAALLLAATVFTTTALAGCGVKEDAVVATVGETKITAGVAEFYARYQAANMETYYGSYYGDEMWSQEYSEGVTMEQQVKNDVMDNLHSLYLLDAHKDEYKVTITEEAQKAIDEAAATFVKENKESVRNKVAGSEASVKEILRLQTIQHKMREAMVADVDREVSDKEAAQKSMKYVFFSFTSTDESGNSTTLTDEEKATLKTQAEKFAKEAKKAKDFEALAKEYSQEAQTTTFDSSSTTPDADLIAAADKLKKGKTTGMIETDNGYYVAKVTSTFDRKATDEKKESIIAEREDEKYNSLIEEWKKADAIKVENKVWNKISFEDLKVTMKVEESK